MCIFLAIIESSEKVWCGFILNHMVFWCFDGITYGEIIVINAKLMQTKLRKSIIKTQIILNDANIGWRVNWTFDDEYETRQQQLRDKEEDLPKKCRWILSLWSALNNFAWLFSFFLSYMNDDLCWYFVCVPLTAMMCWCNYFRRCLFVLNVVDSFVV